VKLELNELMCVCKNTSGSATPLMHVADKLPGCYSNFDTPFCSFDFTPCLIFVNSFLSFVPIAKTDEKLISNYG